MAPDEFLLWERENSPSAMCTNAARSSRCPGGSLRHNRLSAQMIAALVRGVAGGPCGVFSADQKLGVASDRFVYADAVVLCPPITLRPGTTDVAMNPVVVVEVLSKGTEAYDRGDKQQGYLALPSVEHLLLVSQSQGRVELYTRQESGFRYETFAPAATISLRHPAITLSVDELYAGVFELLGD